MHSVRSTNNRIKFLLLFISLEVFSFAYAQENSPYSRYGMGDIVPSQHIASRGMGGFAAAYADFGIAGAPFNLNLTNPAALGSISNTKNFSNTIFDLGTEVDVRTLKSNTKPDKYTSTNTVLSYLQIGFPVSTKKMEKKGASWGVSFGLRPVTRINYKIAEYSRIVDVDSVSRLFEGSGGINQANVSSGFRKTGKGKHQNEFSIGFSAGYTFGNKIYSTKTALSNDSVLYYKSLYSAESRFGGLFLKAGIQYLINLNNFGKIRVGGYADFQQTLKAYQNTNNETFGFNSAGNLIRIDSIYSKNDVKGNVILPATYGFGFAYYSKNNHWLIGGDYELTQWSQYSYFNDNSNVINNWSIRTGVEYYPAEIGSAKNKYFSYVKYRAGFHYGPDYIRIKDVRYNYGITGGLSLPLTTLRYMQTRGEFVCLNTSFEYGGRGNNQSLGLRENFFRISFGVSMNARWFQKRSYD